MKKMSNYLGATVLSVIALLAALMMLGIMIFKPRFKKDATAHPIFIDSDSAYIAEQEKKEQEFADTVMRIATKNERQRWLNWKSERIRKVNAIMEEGYKKTLKFGSCCDRANVINEECRQLILLWQTEPQ